jgi:hypothetical protein
VATSGINSVDNVEQVLLDSPPEGDWTVRVRGTSIQGSQSFSLVSKLSTYEKIYDAKAMPWLLLLLGD